MMDLFIYILLTLTGAFATYPSIQLGFSTSSDLESNLDQTCRCNELDGLLQDIHTQSVFPEICVENNSTSESITNGYPWSHTPVCSMSINNIEPFCVFTNDMFANGRGISFLTTPSLAAELAKSEAFTEPENLTNGQPLMKSPYVVEEIPNKGRGGISVQRLERGEQILARTPVVVFHQRTYELLRQDERRRLQRIALDQLPVETQELFYSAHAHDHADDLVDEIMQSNAFNLHIGKEETWHFALYPEAARFNHDCRPNAQYYFDKDTMTQYIHAIRPILPGEELTISYTDPLIPHAQRRALIQMNWSFSCSCTHCTSGAAQVAASDGRIALIRELEDVLSNWTNADYATPEMAELLVSLYEQERLHGLAAEAYTYAALTHSAAGHAWQALRFASLAVERGLFNAGPKSDEVQTMQAMMSDLVGHWSWMLKARS